MRHLSSNDIEQLAAQLRLQRQATLSAIRQRLHEGNEPDELAMVNHFAEVREQAEADLLADTDIGQLQLELATLRGIDDALARIGAGTYGTCNSCGGPIALQRLRAQPGADKCMPCQQTYEQHRQAPGAPVR